MVSSSRIISIDLHVTITMSDLADVVSSSEGGGGGGGGEGTCLLKVRI